MNKKTISFVELFNGIPMLHNVLPVLEGKTFTDSDLAPRDGYVVIGVMSPLERACFTFLDAAEKKVNAMGDCSFGTLNAGCMQNIVVELEFCPHAQELLALRNEYPYMGEVRDFMFALIRSRMNALYPDLDRMSLNQGFQIMTASDSVSPVPYETFEGWETMSVEDILNVSCKGTFLENIPDVIAQATFIDGEREVGESELVIRTMTDIEKALWTSYSTLFYQKKAKAEEVETLHEGEAFHRMGFAISIGGGSVSGEKLYFPKDKNHPDVAKVEQLKAEIEKLEPGIEVFNTLFWTTVRHGSEEQQKLYDTTGIRKEFQLVMFNED